MFVGARRPPPRTAAVRRFGYLPVVEHSSFTARPQHARTSCRWCFAGFAQLAARPMEVHSSPAVGAIVGSPQGRGCPRRNPWPYLQPRD